MLKKCLTVLCLIGLAACTNTIMSMQDNRPIYDGDNSFPGNGQGIVSYQFTRNGGNADIQAIFVKIDEEINKPTDERFMLNKGGTAFSSAGITEAMLPPGLYVLDSIDLNDEARKGNFNTGSFPVVGKGWDEDKKAPLFLAFRVHAGKKIKLPDLDWYFRLRDNVYITFIVKEDKTNTTGSWIFGSGMDAREVK